MLKGTDFYDACVVNQNVYLAKTIHDSSNSGLNLLAVDQIALNCQHDGAVRRKVGPCTGEFLSISRNKSDIAASRANVSSQHKSKSPGAAGNKDNFVAQPVNGGADQASDNPGAEQKSACGEHNPNIHWKICNAAIERFAAECRQGWLPL
jgi:hypothetical protein